MALDAWRRAELEGARDHLEKMVSGKTGVPVTETLVLFVCTWVLPPIKAALAPTQADRPQYIWWPDPGTGGG